MKMKKVLKIPFKDKEMMTYVGPWDKDIEWKENYEFEDTLEYKDYNRGRSATNFTFTGSDGAEYTMFLSEFNKIVKKMVRGKIKGRWTFMKKGQNYGLKILEKKK